MIKFRERTNTWPGFVDLFSNLVIILIFLLIVFVFLWTTTSVFNTKSGVKKVAELTKVTTEQAQTIANMTADDEESKRLLVLARAELENSDALRAQLESDLAATSDQMTELQRQKESDLDTLTATYKAQLEELNASRETMNQQISQLSEQLNVMQQSNQTNQEFASQEAVRADQLASEIMRLNAALNAADAKARASEVEYLEMSNRLNKAMADKIAQMNEYQSYFYRAVKTALADSKDVQIDGDRFVLPTDIMFKSGQYTISAAGKKQLKTLAKVINDLEGKIPSDVNWIIRVDGHTDNRLVKPGTQRYNDNTGLSLLRAMAVTDELTNNGVSRKRLVPSGFGGLHPVNLGTDAKSLQQNRRIELRLTNP